MDNERSENELIKPMINHLIGNGIDLTKDYAEMALDSFLNPGLLKDVPFLGTVIKLGQSILTVKNLNMTRNYYIFISNLRKDKKIDAKLQEHILELEKHPKKMQQELEILLLYIEQYKEIEKVEYMVNVYWAYLNDTVAGINWETAVAFFEILNRMLPQDIYALEKVVEEGARQEVFSDHSSLLRLSALGLLQYFNGKEEEFGYHKKGLAQITSQGKSFYRVIKTRKIF